MRVLCLGETLLRYSTQKGHRFSELDFKIHVGGSETNIAVNLSHLGMDTKLITKIPNHELGNAIISFLGSNEVDTSSIVRNEMRIGSYFLEAGSGNRASKVIYDRENSAMTSFSLEDFNLERLSKETEVLVVSGITLALNKEVRDSVMTIIKYFKEKNILIVYDNNYRAKMWSIEEAAEAFKEVLPYVDILSAGELDALNFLNLKSQKEDFEDRLEDLYKQIKEIYPNLKYITSTKREIVSSTVNNLTGYLYKDNLKKSNKYVIDDIVDRVGGGDAYISGILYGLLNNKDLDYTVEFGCASSVLKHTIHGDANTFTAEEIESFMIDGVSRIKR